MKTIIVLTFFLLILIGAAYTVSAANEQDEDRHPTILFHNWSSCQEDDGNPVLLVTDGPYNMEQERFWELMRLLNTDSPVSRLIDESLSSGTAEQ